jgi:hypothetical protein
MNTWKAPLLIGAAISASAISASAATSARSDSLHILGDGHHVIAVLRPSVSGSAIDRPVAPLRLRIERGAQPRNWYLVHAQFGIYIRTAPVDGFAVVSVALNGAAAIQYEFKVEHRGRVRWSSVDLINGYRSGTIPLRRWATFHDVNYAQNRSLRKRTATLTFKSEVFLGMKVEAIKFVGDTTVTSTKLPPGKIRLIVEPPGNVVERGQSVQVRYRLVPSGRTLPAVTVHARGEHALVSGATQRYSQLRGAVGGHLEVTPQGSSPGRLVLAVDSASSHPVSVWTFEIRPPAHNGASLAGVWPWAALAIGGTGLVLIAGARIRHRSIGQS